MVVFCLNIYHFFYTSQVVIAAFLNYQGYPVPPPGGGSADGLDARALDDQFLEGSPVPKKHGTFSEGYMASQKTKSTSISFHKFSMYEVVVSFCSWAVSVVGFLDQESRCGFSGGRSNGMEVDSDAVIARQFPFISHPLKKVTISSNGTNFLPTRSAKGRVRNHEVLEGHGTFDFLKAAGPRRNRQMWARPWPAGWNVPTMATSQHPGMNEPGDAFKEQWSKITWGPWLPEVCRGTRSRHMMEETRWLKENKQMWCQQLTTTRTEGSRREIRFSSNLLLHCPLCQLWLGYGGQKPWPLPTVRHLFESDTFSVCSVLNLSPAALAHLKPNQRLETRRPPFVAGEVSPLQKVIIEIFFRVKWEQCIQKMKN